VSGDVGREPIPATAVPRHDVPTERLVDPRAVRVVLAPASAHADLAALILEPPAVSLVPSPRVTGTGVLGGIALPPDELRTTDAGSLGPAVVDGEPGTFQMTRTGPVYATLIERHAEDPATRTPVLILSADPQPAGHATAGRSGVERREVIVDGWRVEVEIESERRAALRDRASRGRAASARDGPTEVRAIIPGVVVSVSVVAGDAVVAGQQLLVVEAMKMQNELRAPRDGAVLRVGVGSGQTIEVGDLMLVLE